MKQPARLVVLLAIVSSFGCPGAQPFSINPYIYDCLDFEALTTGQTFTGGNVISGGGVSLSVATAGWVNPRHARVDNRRYARGTGLDLNLNNVSLDIAFTRAPDAVAFQFGDLGGQLQLNVNGNAQTLNDLHSLNGQTIAGVEIAVTAFQQGANWYGFIVFAGPLSQLTVGGQELWIDNMCGVRLADHIALVDLRSHTSAGPTPHYLVAPLLEVLHDYDIATYEHTTGNLSAGLLSAVDAVIFLPKRGKLTEPEKDLVRNYIDDGGGVLVFGDYVGAPTTTLDVYQDLFDVVGAVHENQNIGIFLGSQNFTNHPITQGVTSSNMVAATTVSGTGYTTVVHTHTTNPANRPLIIAKDQGSGRAVVTGDATFVYNGYIDQYNNAQVFLGMVEWLLKRR